MYTCNLGDDLEFRFYPMGTHGQKQQKYYQNIHKFSSTLHFHASWWNPRAFEGASIFRKLPLHVLHRRSVVSLKNSLLID